MNIQHSIQQQRGVTLAVTLVLLLVVTVLGVTAIRSAVVEEKMTANLRDKHIAFEAAEAALSDAETWLDVQMEYPTPTSAGTNSVWSYSSPGSGDWWNTNSLAWWNTKAISVTGNSMQHAVPRYVIEERAFVQKGENLTIGFGENKQGKYYYQVTARGHGGSESTRSHLRTTFIKRFD
ncbi:type IV pilus assembly protein PilX [Alteromonadaceae bacterium Bs31]|nr:type IV pilus assembly protein PilX [Alteromonadaceae bacterium Bs31]